MQERHDSDVLVIGSGIAGLFYSLQVAQHGTVAIVTKKRATDSATNWAQGGIAAVLDDQDSFDAHARDTINAGAGLCREEVVHWVVERGPAMIDQLLKLGADFDPASPESARSDLAFTTSRRSRSGKVSHWGACSLASKTRSPRRRLNRVPISQAGCASRESGLAGCV